MSRDTTVIPFRQPEAIDDPLTEVAREGARRMLAQVLIAEADAFVAQWKDLKLPDGRDRVVRHGHGPQRTIQTGIGPVEVRRAKVRDRGDVGADEKIRCGFRRMRTVIPIDCGQRFRSIADSVPVIADSGSRRRLQGLTRRCRCQAFHANPSCRHQLSSRPILWFDRHHPSAPTRTRLVPARTVAVKDGPSSGHRVSGAQRP
jgi:hypothetical protein